MVGARTLAMWIVLLGLLVLACGNDDENPTDATGDGKPPAAMVGTWTYQAVSVDGGPAILSDVMEWTTGAVEARLHIQSNSAFVYEEVNASGGQLWAESGFVFIDGGEIDINVQSNSDGPANETTRYAFTLNSDTLTLTIVDQGMTYVFILTKNT